MLLLALPSTFDYSSPFINTSIIFNASGSRDFDGFIVRYLWDFGDGFIGEGCIVAHVYNDPGVYNVSLTVVDNEGHSNTTWRLIMVVVPATLIILCNVSSAKVYIDDVYAGEAPYNGKVSPGKHTVRITANGYNDYVFTVYAEPDKNYTYNIELTPLSLQLPLTTTGSETPYMPQAPQQGLSQSPTTTYTPSSGASLIFLSPIVVFGLLFVPLAGVLAYLVRRSRGGRGAGAVGPSTRPSPPKPPSHGPRPQPSPPPQPPPMATAGTSVLHGSGGVSAAPPGFPAGLLERYKPLDKGPVGEGGFANVWRVRRRSDGRVVALKVLRSGVDEDVFLREVGAWSYMRHPNVVRLYRAGVSPVPYLELEYIEGFMYNGRRARSLRDLLEARYRFGVEDALALIRRVGDALSYAHEKRDLLHLDVKPENILLTSSFVPKLTDWGLAKALGRGSRSTSVPGKAYMTLQYSAPEQLDPGVGGKGPWTDVYQLAAVAYELLAGKPPFTGSPMEVMKSILFDKPMPLHKVNPGVPKLVSDVIMKALEKDPRRRYRSMREFLEALEKAMGGRDQILSEMDKAVRRSTGYTRQVLYSMIRQEMINHLKTAVENRDNEKIIELTSRLMKHYVKILGEDSKTLEKAHSIRYQVEQALRNNIWSDDLVNQLLQTILELEEEIRHYMIVRRGS